MAYATTAQFCDILGLKESIPSWDVAGTPANEEVGTGDDSTLVFYLDYQNVLASSYTLYYGATEPTATSTLTETTHYTLDLTKGKITLTTAGRTLLSTNKIYAAYDHINIGMTDAYLTTVIARADLRVDEACSTTFTDGTADNPSYPSTTEYQPSKGRYDNVYFTDNRPLIDINTTLNGDLTAAATTVPVAAGNGTNFPTTGRIVIGTEIITYTGISTDNLTGCTRGVGDSTAATHDGGDEIHTTIVEISGTSEGTSPTWTVQGWKTQMYTDDQGQIYLHSNPLINDITYEDRMLKHIITHCPHLSMT